MMREQPKASSKDKYFFSLDRSFTISELIDQAEVHLAKLDGSPNPSGVNTLLLLDKIYQQISLNPQLLEEITLSTRYEYIFNQVRKSASLILASFNNIEHLSVEREKHQVNQERWWWYPERILAQRKKTIISKVVRSISIIFILFLVLFLIYNKFVAPPPEVRLRLDHEATVDTFIDNCEYGQALNSVNEALLLYPDYPQFWIKKGILEKIQGDQSSSADAFNQASTLIPREEFLLLRSNAYILFGLNEELLADASEIVQNNPQSAEGYFFQAFAFENLNRVREARDAYEIAFSLAEDQNKSQLAATIKVKQALFLQMFPLPAKE